jgi:hypothetical protein
LSQNAGGIAWILSRAVFAARKRCSEPMLMLFVIIVRPHGVEPKQIPALSAF